MPGKMNPVVAECMDMICFQIMGNDLSVSMAVQAGQMELNVMNPVMIHNILESMVLLNNYIPVFIEKCVSGVKALVIEKGILTKKQADKIFDIEFLIGMRKSDKK